mmetsp:Transcript_57858/g.102807  ORF Transcript_57858/g.102807 Transcript_57858/m.102807 type:complete len:428 (-) Transcript_57858:80-1363(-)
MGNRCTCWQPGDRSPGEPAELNTVEEKPSQQELIAADQIAESTKKGKGLNLVIDVEKAEKVHKESFNRNARDVDSSNLQEPLSTKSARSNSSEAVLQKVKSLVTVDFKILEAEALVTQLQADLTRQGDDDEWEDVKSDPIVKRLMHYWEMYADIGRKVTDKGDSWFQLWQGQIENFNQTLEAQIDPTDSAQKTVRYRAVLTFPAPLSQVLAVGNEIELQPHWQPLLLGPPEVLGKRTAEYFVSHGQMSFLGGLYKIDTLNEIKRFIHEKGGFLAEYISTLPDSSPLYINTPAGFRRAEATQIMNLWLACGPKRTMLVQAGMLVLPMTATKWLISTIGGLAGNKILDGLVRNSMKAAEPGSFWEKPYIEDAHGFYAKLRLCEQAELSQNRGKAPTEGNDPLSNIEKFFKRGTMQPDDLLPITTDEDGI